MIKRTTGYPVSHQQQQGSALLWGMVILIVLTMIGVAAARMTVTDNRIATNQMFSMMSYQGSESTLERVTTLFHFDEAVEMADNQKSWHFSDDVANNGLVNSTGTISMAGNLMCTGQEGFAMSVEMNADAGGIACRLFTIDSRAHLAGTGARSVHAQGVLKYVPGGQQ